MESPAPPAYPVRGYLRLPHRADSVGKARHRVKSEMVDGGLSGQTVDETVMVVSELLTNAIRYARAIAGGVVVLRWRVRDGQVEVEVTDGGSGRVVETRPASNTAVSGRGLRIVERLADSWGVSEHVGGLRTVWAALPVRAPSNVRLARAPRA